MRFKSIIVIFIAVLALTGCETMGDKTKKGVGIGALTGAAIGGIVGHQGGHGWEGALIGGAAGAAAGGLIGNQMDKKDGQQVGMTVYDIAQMAKDGVPDEVIIEEIRRTKSEFELTAMQISYLKDNSVSDRVIDAMLESGR